MNNPLNLEVLPKAFITRKINDIAYTILSARFEVNASSKNEKYPAKDLAELAREYDAILAMPDDVFDEKILSETKKLKVISVAAAGMDNIDLKFAESKEIKVYNTPGIVTNSTADHTFALLLALNRQIVESYNYILKNNWKNWDPEIFQGVDLNDKTLGIVGFGRIGKEVAKRAAGFGMKILFYDIQDQTIENELLPFIQKSDLTPLLQSSDFITVHIPLDQSNKYMFDKSLFLEMNKKPFFINMSRGKIVNTNDLVFALENQLIRGAALDVTDPEPIPSDHPLLKFKNCIVTPHIGTATIEARYQMAKKAAENIIKHFYPYE